ncbi:MAG: L-2-hydroxyglutarate oxidase [Bacteroidetes bacterium]|nr:MAG: L-2-hydroxyglutarate oxidase [Bacteroidota bacterium]
MSQALYDIIVVGGGIVGLSVAYKLQLHHPDLKIVVLEKEDSLSAHQTGRNSGVIHSGLYYKPGSYKAKNCVSGRRELVQFAQTHKVPHDVCGKVVVATHESELPFMEKIFQNGIANGVEGIEKIHAQQVMEIEPHCTSAIGGIWVPVTGIIDYPAVVFKLAELLHGMNPESEALTGQEVREVVQGEEYAEVVTQKARFRGRRLIFCGGLHSDRLAKKDQVQSASRIVGFRGDYWDLAPHAEEKVRNLIYPIPNPAFPFLGVHFTRMIRGGIECGPSAVFTFKREGYGRTDFNLRDTWEALTFKGTWKLFSRHWRFGLDEQLRAFSKRRFLKQVQRLIPSLTLDDLVEGRSGVRAMALGPDGNMIEDFDIAYSGRSIHILNAPSPAATACLAIGEEVAQMAGERFGLKA